MSSGLSSDFKETVRARTNLVELVGETISLTPQRGGADYLGLCPFHDDKNPSFHVYPDRQSWRCWVCNEGGDCFSFVEKTEGIGFFDSLKLLADRAGIEMPSRMAPSPQQQQRKSLRDEMFSALQWAEEQMHHCLMHSPVAQHARDYLRNRGYTHEQIQQFRLGYHPDNWEWLLGQVANRFENNALGRSQVDRSSEERSRLQRFSHFHRSRGLPDSRSPRPHDQLRRTAATGKRRPEILQRQRKRTVPQERNAVRLPSGERRDSTLSHGPGGGRLHRPHRVASGGHRECCRRYWERH